MPQSSDERKGVKLTQRHLNLAREREVARERIEHARHCFVTLQEMLDQQPKLPVDGDLVALALWHDAVNTAVSVYELIEWRDDTIRGSIGMSDGAANGFAHAQGWDDAPVFDEWRVERHHLAHVLRRKTISFPLRRTLPVAHPPGKNKGKLRHVYISDFNFQELPDRDAIKRFDQFSNGLEKAVIDWHNRENAKADAEAKRWFEKETVQKRKSMPMPDRVVEAHIDTPQKIVAQLLAELTDHIRVAFATSRLVAQYRYEIKKELKLALGLVKFKTDWLNAQLDSEEEALVQWAYDSYYRVEALNRLMKEAGGGSPTQMMKYEVDMARYDTVLEEVRAERSGRL